MVSYGFDSYNQEIAEEIVQPLRSHEGGDSTPKIMQKVTGCLSQGAHPGSYNGQDAYNDMLVVQDGRTNCDGIPTSERRNHAGGVSNTEYDS